MDRYKMAELTQKDTSQKGESKQEADTKTSSLVEKKTS